MEFSEVENLVQNLIGQTEVAISLKQLCKRLNSDKRVGPAYDDTYAGHGFVLARSSIDYAFALSLTRMNEYRPDVSSLARFFNLFSENLELIEGGILDRRLKWVDAAEARADTDEHLGEIEEASGLHRELLGSHQWARTNILRHKHIAHAAIDRKKIQLPKYEYLYALCDKTVEIVQQVARALLGLGAGFSEYEEIWGMYSEEFFESMIVGTKTPGNTELKVI